MKKAKLVREQLDVSLRRFRPLLNTSTPQKGWIRAICGALGMTAKQLAGRLGISQQSVARIEKDELTGAVTIKTMRRVAEQLNCTFVCGFVPCTSLEETVVHQARKVAIKRLARVSQTMRLEDQALSSKGDQQVLDDVVNDLVVTLPPALWNEL